MRILGLDASLASTGWNIITDEDEILACDKICTDAKSNTEIERIYIIANRIKELIKVNSVDVVVAEDQFFSKNPKTGLTLSRLMGAIMYICQDVDVQLELLTPTQARKILTGNGNLKKVDVAEFIRKNYIDLGEYSDREAITKGIEKTSDKYDSLAVSLAWNKLNKLNKKYGTNK